MSRLKIILFVIAMAVAPLAAQTPDKADKGRLEKEKGVFYEKILSELDAYKKSAVSKPETKSFVMDFSGKNYPVDLSLYKTQWHGPLVSQGTTSNCWAYSTVSFLESDLHRLYGIKVNLSQIFVVYHEYLAKAARYIETRGESYFGPGSEANAVTRQIGQWGIVPYEAYTGLKPGQPFHDHGELFSEIRNYLKGVKAAGAWDIDANLHTVRAILNHHLGTPPETFEWQGKAYTPKSFRDEALRLKVDDYEDILSYLQQPYWKKVEYECPDNWWHDKSYYNVPLDVFMDTLKDVVKKGYTVSIGGDVSEPGYSSARKVGVIPTFDIPRAYIDENARQFRFSNQSTTDDHGIHIVGYTIQDGDWWFVIKDSGSGSRDVAPEGYRFVREDYIKLKWMNFTVHKSAVPDLLKKFE